MNISHLMAMLSAASLICLTMGAAAAQPADPTRDTRSRPGADAKQNADRPEVQPRPGIGKPADAVKDVQSQPPESKPTKPVRPPKNTTLTVRKILVPSLDPGRFNLSIDGVVHATAVGNNGSTGPISVTAGTHSVSEMAGISTTNLANYTTVIGGGCSPSAIVVLTAGQNKTCTITNTRKKAKPPVLTEGVQLEGVLQPQVSLGPPPHGSWTQGPGTYNFNVCPVGTQRDCVLYATAGLSIPITMEIWGGGGGGGGGQAGGQGTTHGGAGAGGGGGGGYAKTTITVVVPPGGSVSYYVKVGAGGAGVAMGYINGVHGAPSEVKATSFSGPLVLQATGGGRGYGTSGGAFGNGVIGDDLRAGTAGLVGGYATACPGHAGGLGGAGGGPGRTGPGYINDGGDGGHGGYNNRLGCTTQSQNNEQSAGKPGGNGKVTFTW